MKFYPNGNFYDRARKEQMTVSEVLRVGVQLASAVETYSRAVAELPAVIECLAVMGAMMLMTSAYWMLVVPGHMTAVELSGFGLFLLRLMPLVTRVYGAQGNLIYLASSVREVTRWLEMPIFPDRPFGSTTIDALRQGIEIRDLSFAYPDGSQALTDVSFTIPAGKMVALVGRSGSGKSTLASLLLRLRPPTSGKVLVDGIDYWELSAESWHNRVAVVEQDVFMFNDTLSANIAYGTPAPTDSQIAAVIEASQMTEVVAALPAGLDSQIGERGVSLSGGQRQRLAIARALFRNPDFLILDEATSHLDSVSEKLVQTAIAEATRGRTTLVIAHRLSTIRRADWIVVLDGGRVAEQGTWEALTAAEGIFTGLVLHSFETNSSLGLE